MWCATVWTLSGRRSQMGRRVRPPRAKSQISPSWLWNPGHAHLLTFPENTCTTPHAQCGTPPCPIHGVHGRNSPCLLGSPKPPAAGPPLPSPLPSVYWASLITDSGELDMLQTALLSPTTSHLRYRKSTSSFSACKPEPSPQQTSSSCCRSMFFL